MPPQPTFQPSKPCRWCGTPMTRKRYPPRNVLECNANFIKRKFCSLSCSVSHQHSIEAPTVAAARKRAQKMRRASCEACGVAVQLAVHHLDENPKNNAEANQQTLCMSCHGFWHGVRSRSPKTLPPRMPQLFL